MQVIFTHIIFFSIFFFLGRGKTSLGGQLNPQDIGGGRFLTSMEEYKAFRHVGISFIRPR